ncbi:hypothetical protein [Streptomyces actinomycinicus]|nr:hypothetical protein [Streptomyces actinomycinicus]
MTTPLPAALRPTTAEPSAVRPTPLEPAARPPVIPERPATYRTRT